MKLKKIVEREKQNQKILEGDLEMMNSRGYAIGKSNETYFNYRYRFLDLQDKF